MDNLTHSLIGAALGQAGLKRKTGLGMPALIIAANLPDIDAPATLMGVESLAIRRGITHGPIALVVLPLLLAWGLAWWDRRQARRGTRPEARLPVRFGWLVALCYIGALTHLLFDWFNSYGIRLLEPFSHQWFAGDMLFIVDPWIIAVLGFAVWSSLRRERSEDQRWQKPARWALAFLPPYLFFNFSVTALANGVYDGPRLRVANPVFAKFWEREILGQGLSIATRKSDRMLLSSGRYNVFLPYPAIDYFGGPSNNMSDPRIAAWSKHDPKAQAFLFWSRMPVAELYPDRIILRDQRFLDRRTAGNFSVILRPPTK